LSVEVDGGRFRTDAAAVAAAAAVVNVVVVETEALFDAADIVVHDVLAADTVACAVDIAVVETVVGVELLGHLICAHRFVRTLPIENLKHFFPIIKAKAIFFYHSFEIRALKVPN